MEAMYDWEPEMILVSAGEFLMGSDPEKDKDAYDEEHPQQTVHLPDYYLAKTPVTNAQYLAFVKATGHRQPDHWKDGKPPRGKEEHPVVHVSWHDAVAYCRWLAEITGKPYRLPTEAEREKGARGTDGRIYPWGNQKPTSELCNLNRNVDDTTPVGTYPRGASPYGLLDMSGNVWEWCATRWQEKYPLPQVDEWRDDYLGGKDLRVLRGGAFGSIERDIRCADRGRDDPNNRDNDFGFRCVRSPGG